MPKLHILLLSIMSLLSSGAVFGQEDVSFTSLSDCRSHECHNLFDDSDHFSFGESKAQEPLLFSRYEANDILHDSLFIASTLLAKNTVEEDKLLHYIAGAATGRIAAELCAYWRLEDSVNLSPEKIKFLCSAGTAALIGALKEVYDHKYGGNVEVEDFLATAAGGLFISLRYKF